MEGAKESEDEMCENLKVTGYSSKKGRIYPPTHTPKLCLSIADEAFGLPLAFQGIQYCGKEQN